MGKTKRMDQIKLIIKTFLSCGSVKGTARRLQVSKNTVKQYIRLTEQFELSLQQALEVPDSSLQQMFSSVQHHRKDKREDIFNEQIGEWIRELRRPGVTKHLLWEEYRCRHPDGYGRSQFCDRLKRAIARRDLTLSMEHKAGEVMQLDFAGKKMSWVDPYNGELHECEVLIAVLPHSHYSFAIALPSQKVMDFIDGINQALLFFGKVPKVILSDNLKSYVKKADRYDPDFNDLCVQLAAHYELDLQATRVRKPKDKASVENAVRTIYNRIYAPLRNEVFHSIEELNEAIRLQLSIHNARPFQKKAGSRQEVFEQFEQPVMNDLPADLFEANKTVKAKVQRNYHIFLGEEKNYYSVPFQYALKQATVIYNSKIVEVYIGSQRVATHSRLCEYDTYRYRTEEVHMPKNHQEWRKTQGYNAAYFIEQAQKIGPATEWAMRLVLLSRINEVQSYKSCKGILYLGKKHTNERLEQACMRCKSVGKTNYSMLKRILELKLDQRKSTPDLFSTPTHDNIRGPQAYQ